MMEMGHVHLTVFRNRNNKLNSKNHFFWLALHGSESRYLDISKNKVGAQTSLVPSLDMPPWLQRLK